MSRGKKKPRLKLKTTGYVYIWEKKSKRWRFVGRFWRGTMYCSVIIFYEDEIAEYDDRI